MLVLWTYLWLFYFKNRELIKLNRQEGISSNPPLWKGEGKG